MAEMMTSTDCEDDTLIKLPCPTTILFESIILNDVPLGIKIFLAMLAV
jgi:hypothetical protein